MIQGVVKEEEDICLFLLSSVSLSSLPSRTSVCPPLLTVSCLPFHIVAENVKLRVSVLSAALSLFIRAAVFAPASAN